MTRAAEPLDPAWFDYFAERDVPVVNGYGAGLRTLKAVLDLYGLPDRAAGWTTAAIPAHVSPRGQDTLLSWSSTQELINSWGISHVAAGVASTAEEALEIAERIGYPVVCKGLVPGVLHKSAAGLVRAGIADADALARACADIAGQPAAHASPGPLEFELQQMVSIEVEMLLGMVRDPIMGPVITVGAGGTAVESIGDVACVLPPVSDDEIVALLSSLQVGSRIFNNHRISSEQRQNFVQLVRRFAEGVVKAGESIGQVDINPVVLTSAGEVVAVDAVVMTQESKGAER
jgi:hypothetical protein